MLAVRTTPLAQIIFADRHLVTEAGPTAFANIKQNYYYVFAGCSAFFCVMAYFFFPETKQKSLEEIAAAFGDKVIAHDADVKDAIYKGAGKSEHQHREVVESSV
jgi:hypothetical protein